MTRRTNRALFSLLLILIFIFICPTPGFGSSTDILIEKNGTLMSWTDARIDNNLVATYVSTNSPQAIRVYFTNGIFYKNIPLTNEKSRLESLEIADDRVYYAASGDPETVYQYNLATSEKKAIYTTDGSQQKVTKIVASGDHVVLRGGTDDQKLILHTLSTGTSQVIFTSRDWILDVDIDGDRITWGCNRVDGEPGREIHVYTISTGKDTIIPESKSVKTYGYGSISGNNVIWVMSAKDPDYINGVPVTSVSYDMKLTNIASGKTQSIEQSDTAPMTVPFISGDTVAWVKKPNVDYDNSDIGTIRTYNITAGTFGDFASDVDYISDFNSGVILWGRLHPVSFWVTPISGKIPEVTSPTLSQTTPQVPTTVQKPTTSQKSPVDPIMIVSAIAAGAVGYTILKRKR
jgi:hypothetical protein